MYGISGHEELPQVCECVIELFQSPLEFSGNVSLGSTYEANYSTMKFPSLVSAKCLKKPSSAKLIMLFLASFQS